MSMLERLSLPSFRSLAFRLFATAAAWTLVVLPVAGLILHQLYRQEVEEAHDRRLKLLLTVVVADSFDHARSEPGTPRDVGEPLFEISHSGWYWQIKPLDDTTAPRLVSFSLASERLELPSEGPAKPDGDNIIWKDVTGPLGERLRIAEQIFAWGEESAPRRYSYAVAGTIEEVTRSVQRFRNRLAIALTLVGLGLVAVTAFQVRFGLHPLRAIERGLQAIRSGEAQKLEGTLPDEIRPLQSEINALIRSNQDIIERARTQVGNLAHALKTPLAVITNEARDERSPLSRKVTEQAEIMRDQVNHYLDRARMAARAGVIGRVTEVRPVLVAIERALSRIYVEKGLAFDLECPADARFQGEKQDLEEMVGNLLDNAAKWARSRVVVTVAPVPPAEKGGPARLAVTIDDDGPGLTDEQRREVGKRGRRLDETKPGSGLGLSIVADLAQSYRGNMALDAAPAGGLRIRLELPAA